MIAKEIRQVVRMTSANMDPAMMFRQRKKRWRSLGSLSQGSTNSNMLDIQGGSHKKRARRSSLLNAKKLYEDAQMARKVKQYLSGLDVETDEEKFQMMSLQWEPAYGTLTKNVSEKRCAKSSEMSPVPMRSAGQMAKVHLHQPHRVSQVLQVPAVNLHPIRKRGQTKDSALSTSLPQKVLGTTDDTSSKKPAEDTLSVASSLHASPPASPQGSPRKIGSFLSDPSLQLHLSGSSSAPPRESSTSISGLSCPGIGGVYLQKKILQITRSTAKRPDSSKKATEENRDRTSCENTSRKRMTSPFRRFRERTLSRERLVNSKKEDADHKQAADSCEQVKDVGSNIKDEKGNDICNSNSRGNSNSLNCFYTRFKSKRRKTL